MGVPALAGSAYQQSADAHYLRIPWAGLRVGWLIETGAHHGASKQEEIGAGSQGKLPDSGAMTVLAEGVLPEKMVLSNRDKALHSGERGLGSRQVQTEQFHDDVG